jgi:hypothetical protein
VNVNNCPVFRGTVSTAFENMTIPVTLKRGDNTLEFVSVTGSTRPTDVPGLNSMDLRPLSIAIQAITISGAK